MSAQIKDGGPESRQLAGTMYADNQGMSLRDYFAAQALAGWCANPGAGRDTRDHGIDANCKAAYTIADAMLKAREQR